MKMMRYSMLKRINDEKAQKLVKEKKYIAVYVPMHLEFVLPFNNKKLSEENMIRLFQVAFNCYLSESLLAEVKSMVEDIGDEYWMGADHARDIHITSEDGAPRAIVIISYTDLENPGNTPREPERIWIGGEASIPIIYSGNNTEVWIRIISMDENKLYHYDCSSGSLIEQTPENV